MTATTATGAAVPTPAQRASTATIGDRLDWWREHGSVDFPTFEPSVYDRYVGLFAPAFPGAEPAAVERLEVASRLYASAIFQLDDVIDGEEKDQGIDAGGGPLRLAVWWHEAYRSLAGVFDPASAFWDSLGACLARYLRAMHVEADHLAGRRAPTDLTWELFVELARGKAAVAEVVPEALGALAGAAGPARAVVDSIVAYNVVCGVLDDVVDWRSDLAGHRPNHLVAEALRQRGGPADEGALALTVYSDGVLGSSLDRARDLLRSGRRDVADLPLEAWQHVLAGTNRRLDGVLATVTSRAGARPSTGYGRVVLRWPDAVPGSWDEVATGAARWLLREAATGFREARHLMRFPHAAGFTGAQEVQSGDVFSRAVIANALAVVRPSDPGALIPVLRLQGDHLLQRRRPEVGGWAYFPDLPELPCDADDLAEVVRLLSRDEVAEDRGTAVRTALLESVDAAFASLSDGFATWVLPIQPELLGRQRHHVEASWGSTFDVEVLANLCSAAEDLDADRYADEVAAGRRTVAQEQRSDGSWPAQWYHSGLWSSWVCVRLLAGDAAWAPSVRRALRHVLATQAGDGGWAPAPGRPTTAVDTALALLALDAGLRSADGDLAAGAAAAGVRARVRLADLVEADGGFGADHVIRMNLGRARGADGPVVGHGSRSLSTALVAAAASRWAQHA